jgi:predicted methyltransferase
MNPSSAALPALLLAAATLIQATAAIPVPGYVTAAIADPARPAQQMELDQWRRPAEVIAFAGLKPGDRIADFMSGGGYFTRIFSRVVGAEGRVYAFLPAQQLANCAPEETAGSRALAGDRGYANVRVLIDAADRFAVPEPLDMVWTAQNYHDLHDRFMAPTDLARLNAAIFRSLKPGGVFLVIDHVAAPGSGLRDSESLHRIEPAAVVSEVTAAGFRLEAESAVLRNPNDSHQLTVFDPAIRHRTDQVVLKFRKPLQP